MNRPTEGQYKPYFATYINKVAGDNILEILKNQVRETTVFLNKIPLEKWEFAYASGKWTLAESWIHVNDTERIFAYRALRIARGDQTIMPGFEQDDYVPYYLAQNRSPESIISEFVAVRTASLSLLETLNAEAWKRTGTAGDHVISVNAIAFIMAGHVQHHLDITENRYLTKA